MLRVKCSCATVCLRFKRFIILVLGQLFREKYFDFECNQTNGVDANCLNKLCAINERITSGRGRATQVDWSISLITWLTDVKFRPLLTNVTQCFAGGGLEHCTVCTTPHAPATAWGGLRRQCAAIIELLRSQSIIMPLLAPYRQTNGKRATNRPTLKHTIGTKLHTALLPVWTEVVVCATLFSEYIAGSNGKVWSIADFARTL